MEYSGYDIADFASDGYFVSWVLSPDEKSDAFWNYFSAAHPDKAKTLYEARLLVLLMSSRRLAVDDQKKELLWEAIQQKAFAEETTSAPQPQNNVVRPKRMKRWLSVAAVLTMAVLCYYFLRPTTASDQIIVLNPKGKKSILYLPDGTKVWLNAESLLTYPNSFERRVVREVKLEGEAFFDVTENKTQPFIVRTSQLQVKVLGTSFNVKSYGNENTIETTLVHGRVMIELNDDNPKHVADEPVMLKENEQAVYSTSSNRLSLRTVKTESATSWKEGKLTFLNKPFSEIEEELERWYGVEIILDDESGANCHFSTTIENEPINKILDLFKTTSGISYEMINNTIHIKGRLCGASDPPLKK